MLWGQSCSDQCNGAGGGGGGVAEGFAWKWQLGLALGGAVRLPHVQNVAKDIPGQTRYSRSKGTEADPPTEASSSELLRVAKTAQKSRKEKRKEPCLPYSEVQTPQATENPRR